jgi:hypothetical protein
MADDKKFNLEIGTSADTSGLEAVERQLKAVAAAGKSAANPMADGSQLRAGAGAGAAEDPAEAARETTKAIEEQAEALADLTDEQAGVVDATKRMNQEAGKPDGFQKLFTQQRLIQIANEFGNLARTVGQFATEFAKTEAGKEMLSGLSEEAQALGSTVLSVSAGVAQGFATGGPVGGAIAGTTALVKILGDSFLAVQRAEEEGAAAFAKAQSEYQSRARERERAATSDAIERQFEREADKLEDQNEKLREQAGLLDARRRLEDENFALFQEKQRGEGRSEADLRRDQILYEARKEEERIASEEKALADRRDAAEKRRADALQKRELTRIQGLGTKGPEFAAADKAFKEADEAFDDTTRGFYTGSRSLKVDRTTNAVRLERRLAEDDRRREEEKARDTERRAEETRRRQEEADRARADEARRRQQLGREGEGIADGLIGGAANGRQQAALEQIGNRIAADPNGGGLGQLADAVEKMMGAADEARRRDLRQAMERIARLEAKLKTKGDSGS